MADSIVQIIINAIDNASGATGQVKLAFTELNSALSLVQQGLGMVDQAFDATVGHTLELASNVRRLQRDIGATPEEASKLINVADDVGVSFETLTHALDQAIKKGLDPTIDGLARMADQYNAIQDPIERTKFLLDSFGRAGAEMGPLMQLGSQGIEKMSADLEKLGLVMSKDTVQSAKELALQMNELKDVWEGIRVQWGEALLPVLKGIGDYMAWAGNAGHDAYLKIKDFVDLMIHGVKPGVENAAVAVKTLATTMDTLGNAATLTGDALDNLNARNQQYAQDTLYVTETMTRLNALMAGQLGPNTERYEQTQAKLADDMKKVADEIQKDTRWYGEASTKVQELKGKYQDLGDEYARNAEEHDKATKKILFDILQQQLAVNGLSTTEATMLGQIAKDWGLIDKPTQEAYDLMMKYTSQVDESARSVGNLKFLIEQLPKSLTINVNWSIPAFPGIPNLGGGAMGYYGGQGPWGNNPPAGSSNTIQGPNPFHNPGAGGIPPVSYAPSASIPPAYSHASSIAARAVRDLRLTS